MYSSTYLLCELTNASISSLKEDKNKKSREKIVAILLRVSQLKKDGKETGKDHFELNHGKEPRSTKSLLLTSMQAVIKNTKTGKYDIKPSNTIINSLHILFERLLGIGMAYNWKNL